MSVVGEKIDALKPDCVRLYPTLVVEGTDLACWYRGGQYVPLTLEEAVDQTAWLLRFFEDRDISVIRVGLHAEASLEPKLYCRTVSSCVRRDGLLAGMAKVPAGHAGSRRLPGKSAGNFRSASNAFQSGRAKAGKYPLAGR